VTDVDLFPFLLRLLTSSNREITIMMLDPESPVLPYRYGTEEMPLRPSLTSSSARVAIMRQLHDLAEVQKELKRVADQAVRHDRHVATGTLKVLLYSCAPTLVSYQTDDTMLIGMLLLHESANAGPMILVRKGEPLWGLVEGNWATVVRVATEMKQPPSNNPPAASPTAGS
jgi:hypothetical protein